MPNLRFLSTACLFLSAVNRRFKDCFSNIATLLAKRLTAPLLVLGLPVLLLGCDATNQGNTAPSAKTTTSATDTTTVKVSEEPHLQPHPEVAAPTAFSRIIPPSTKDHPVQIDWTKIDTKVAPISVKTFDYPLAIDGAPVKAFADFAKVTPKQAQHALTVSTASNEAVVKLLDQLGDSYVSHKVTDDGSRLIVYTTPNVAASHFDYVLADNFARGLVLPIEIRSQPK